MSRCARFGWVPLDPVLDSGVEHSGRQPEAWWHRHLACVFLRVPTRQTKPKRCGAARPGRGLKHRPGAFESPAILILLLRLVEDGPPGRPYVVEDGALRRPLSGASPSSAGQLLPFCGQRFRPPSAFVSRRPPQSSSTNPTAPIATSHPPTNERVDRMARQRLGLRQPPAALPPPTADSRLFLFFLVPAFQHFSFQHLAWSRF